MTNMERIQSLPRFQLAELLAELAECPYQKDPECCPRSCPCVDCWIDWLNQTDD